MKFCLRLLLVAASAAATQAATINFDDGTAGAAIGAFYSAQGVTFSNAAWSSTAVSGATGLALADITDSGFNPPFSPTSTTPIVGTFSSAEGFVSILAADVGDAGAELDVYNAVSGGTLIGHTNFYGVGGGVGTSITLSLSIPGIMRFELYQPTPTSGDGLVWDNLSFSGSAVPEPASWITLASGLSLVGLKLRKR